MVLQVLGSQGRTYPCDYGEWLHPGSKGSDLRCGRDMVFGPCPQGLQLFEWSAPRQWGVPLCARGARLPYTIPRAVWSPGLRLRPARGVVVARQRLSPWSPVSGALVGPLKWIRTCKGIIATRFRTCKGIIATRFRSLRRQVLVQAKDGTAHAEFKIEKLAVVLEHFIVSSGSSGRRGRPPDR